MALQRKPKHPEAHYHLGRALFLKGDLEGAKSHYLETAQLDPKAPVHNSLGVVYMKLGQTPEAIAEFNEALRLRPNDADAAENLRFALSRDATVCHRPRCISIWIAPGGGTSFHSKLSMQQAGDHRCDFRRHRVWSRSSTANTNNVSRRFCSTAQATFIF